MDQNRRKNAQKIIMAMSGGLDSSVAAALLKRAGLHVVGVFMRFWMVPEKNGLVGAWNRCCSPEAENRARKVAKILNIPFYVFNFEKEFKKRIVDYFLKEYKRGVTPNPCVVCNKEIKFGLLLEKALGLGSDYIATGHYARLEGRRRKAESGKSCGQLSTCYSLLSACDKNKDQSYFLWQLNQKQLKHILFPVGEYKRAEVERMAKKFKLPFSNVKKSMEICFIQTTINDFLTRYLKTKPGPIVTVEEKKIGQHRGLPFYTIGQRKGIGLSGGPYYVVAKDRKKNYLIVSKNEKDLVKKELIVKNVNWISGKEPRLPLKVMAKIRYRHQPALATITKILNPKTYTLKFSKPQRAITPGQSVVFYKGKEVLGGGVIG